jgi:hypothetical protein
LKRHLHRSAWIALTTLLLTTLIVAVPILHSHSSQKAHASAVAPTLKVSPKVVRPGVSVKVTGSGFSPESYIDLYLNNVVQWPNPIFSSDANGNLSATIKLPVTSVPQGRYTLIAVDEVTNNKATTVLTFLPYVPPVAGQSGLPVQYSGVSFAANETVSIYWGADASGLSEGTATTDATGKLSFSFTPPTGLASGIYPITITRTNQRPASIRTYFKIFPLSLVAEPGGIHSGKSVTIKVAGFVSSERVDIQWNANGGQSIGDFATDKNGAGKTTIVPPSAPIGTYTITASDNHGLQATSTLAIGPGIAVDGYSVLLGTNATILGGGFGSGETISVYLQTPKNGIVSATTDSTGAFSVELSIPSTYNPATHYFVYAVNATGTEHTRTPLKFLTPTVIIEDEYSHSSDTYYDYNMLFDGEHFAANETVNIYWNYQRPGQYIIASNQADAIGSFLTGFLIPSTLGSTVTIAVVGATSHVAIVQTVNNYPTVFANGGTDTGQSVTVNGGSFGANDTINILFSGKVVATTTSASDGTFSTTILLPEYPGVNPDEIEAQDATANLSATQLYYYNPIVTATPSTVHNGDQITVNGTRFQRYINLYLQWGAFGPGIPLGDAVVADGTGSFTVTAPVQGVPAGSYLICADAFTGLVCTTNSIVVQ